jgi:hypothetical protein
MLAHSSPDVRALGHTQQEYSIWMDNTQLRWHMHVDTGNCTVREVWEQYVQPEGLNMRLNATPLTVCSAGRDELTRVTSKSLLCGCAAAHQ